MEKIFVWMVNPEKTIYWDGDSARLCLACNKQIQASLSEAQIGFDFETAQTNIENWARANGLTNPDAKRIGDYGRKAAWGLND